MHLNLRQAPTEDITGDDIDGLQISSYPVEVIQQAVKDLQISEVYYSDLGHKFPLGKIRADDHDLSLIVAELRYLNGKTQRPAVLPLSYLKAKNGDGQLHSLWDILKPKVNELSHALHPLTLSNRDLGALSKGALDAQGQLIEATFKEELLGIYYEKGFLIVPDLTDDHHALYLVRGDERYLFQDAFDFARGTVILAVQDRQRMEDFFAKEIRSNLK